jgi:hypothetical protein
MLDGILATAEDATHNLLQAIHQIDNQALHSA